MSWSWYGTSRAIEASAKASVRLASRRARVEPLARSPRAYGFATSKTLKSGYTSCPTDASVAIALSSITKREGSLRLSE